MLGKCMNPGCLRTFHYFGQGRVYLRPCNCSPLPRGREMSLCLDCSTPVEYFWLCEQCCLTLTLSFDASGRPVVRQRYILLPPVPPAQRAAG